MKKFDLKAEPRTELSKQNLKQLRKEGKIPAVISGGKIVDLPYDGPLKPGEKVVPFKPAKKDGKTIENKRGVICTDIAVNGEDVRKLIYTPEIFEVDLDLNGETKKVVMKDLQFQPVKDTVLHIDFLEVYPDKPIVMEVPVQVEGHAEGVKAGGKLSLVMRKLKTKATYDKIPEKLVVNVDHLGLGQALSVGDLHFDGLELMNAKNAVVCAVKLTRAARGAAAKAEE